MIALVEGAVRQRTPNEIALAILLAALTIVFLLAVGTLQPFAIYAGDPVATVILVALLVCLIPTTIGGLLSAIGIAGMDRVTRFNVLAMSGRAVEAAGDVDTLLLDKTGTITYGNRLAAEFVPVDGVSPVELAAAAHQASLGDETPEGRSIVALAEQHGVARRERAARGRGGRAVQRRDPDERPAPRRPGVCQGRGRRGTGLGRCARSDRADDRRGRAHLEGRRDPAGRGCRRRASWGSSTSRTRSSRACASGSRSSGGWGSARSWSPATTR